MSSKNKKISKFTAVERARDLIDHLSEKELMMINQLVVEKLKYIQKSSSLKAMSNFIVGDRICFERNDELVTGVVKKLNQKTISIETDEGIGWNVAPSFLKRYIDAD
ncbi:hypothetical protein N9X24_00450 [Rickettsiales bacterium]|nr:hypothetical protein [Rickettsiales bacterium]